MPVGKTECDRATPRQDVALDCGDSLYYSVISCLGFGGNAILKRSAEYVAMRKQLPKNSPKLFEMSKRLSSWFIECPRQTDSSS